VGRRTNRRRSNERYERKINHRQWFTNLVGQSFNPLDSTDAQLVSLPSMTLKSDDCTVLRTRGQIDVAVQHPSDSTLVRCVLGMIVMPAKYANEVSNLPNPLEQNDSDDWFVWQSAEWMDVVVIGGTTSLLYSLKVDSKAMRKMEADEVVKPVIGIQAPLAAFGSDDRVYFVGVNRVLVGY